MSVCKLLTRTINVFHLIFSTCSSTIIQQCVVSVASYRSSLTWVVWSWKRRRRKVFRSGGRRSLCLTEHTCTAVSPSAFLHFSAWAAEPLRFHCFPSAGLSSSASKSPSRSAMTRVSVTACLQANSVRSEPPSLLHLCGTFPVLLFPDAVSRIFHRWR